MVAAGADDAARSSGPPASAARAGSGEVTPPKGGREGIVPLTARLALVLCELARSGQRVLTGDDGAEVNRAWVSCAMKRAQRRAGMVQDGRVHILRHTFCSRLAMLNVPAMSIGELAGHVSLQSTQRYLHLSSRAKVQAIQALDGAVGLGTRLTPGPATQKELLN